MEFNKLNCKWALNFISPQSQVLFFCLGEFFFGVPILLLYIYKNFIGRYHLNRAITQKNKNGLDNTLAKSEIFPLHGSYVQESKSPCKISSGKANRCRCV